MFGLPIVTITILSPLVGGLFALGVNDQNTAGAKAITFWTSLFTLFLAIINFITYDFATNFGYTEESYIFGHSFIKYSVSTDKLSILFVLLISFICFISTLWLLKRPLQKTKKYFAALLLFESFSIGTFCAQDMFLLYIFMEATIIPLYLMMLNRPNPAHDAIFQYLLYTIISAFLILIALIMINLETKTTNLTDLYRIGIKNKTIFWLLITGIGIKMPIWPFYHWLPIVHVKSQTVCSIILAAIVLKFATLLVLRLVEPIFGEILISNRGVLIFILIISMSFATAQLMFQDDVKSIFAYFSIIHLNLYFMILLSGTETKYYIFSVIYHSIAVAILFFVAEMIKRVFNTRLIEIIKTQSTKFYGINKIVAAAFFILIAAPFSWGFICEIIAISSIVKISLPCTFIISGIILLSTCYAITTYVRGFGTNKKNTQFNELQKFHINDNYKKTVLYALFGLIITFGLRPTLFLNFF